MSKVINNKHILCLVLARGGSKSVPRKNIRLLNGKPLLSYALTEALKVFPKVYLSTEDSEIAQVAKEYGATTLNRPSKLAQDDSKSIEVVKCHLKELYSLEGSFDAILLINSCTPFLKKESIEEVVNLALSTKADSVTSLVEDFSAHPSKVCYLVGDNIFPTNTSYTFETGERQKLSKIYRRNTCLYLATVKTIKNGSFFGKNAKGVIMKQEESLDINSPYDFLIAELYAKYGL